MGFRVDVERLLYALPYSRTLRELARNSKVSHTAARRIVRELSTEGAFRFVPDDSFYGLTRLVAFVDRVPRRLPFTTTGVRSLVSQEGMHTLVMAYLPEALAGKYVESLSEEAGVLEWFVTRDYVAWLPRPELRGVSPGEFDGLVDRAPEYIPPRTNLRPLAVPDQIDLVLLWGKLLMGPFARPTEIYSRASREEGLPAVSKQVLSYHYRAHVQPGWRYSTYFKYISSEELPFVAYYVRGREAERVARALALLPNLGMSLIGDGRALYMGQLQCRYHTLFAEIPQSYGVEATLMFMKLDLRLDVPRLWRLLDAEHRKWRWVEEKVEVRARH
ncbi:hypothetical protein IG193_08795 [Infirmifilum lucidum]|uniref:Uncharacterized protein n=1 Tax=Infirmifilum lucidum TaxID=2776706 RepID=A0A7L9FG85_9CREN|nr:hypothetical protein [Infirmifilum lucidum]QOJ78828.1 hypothetical protein IG193_08795 [Infirmifilum lucidum]